jgi:hypothetical protein
MPLCDPSWLSCLRGCFIARIDRGFSGSYSFADHEVDGDDDHHDLDDDDDDRTTGRVVIARRNAK